MTSRICKRIIDTGLAAVGLLLGLPLMVIVGLMIWLDDPGSVLFAQTRLGLHGKPFRLLKFRKFSAKCGNAGPGVTVAGDARMTRIGAILERTKLDELPQLWNILIGDMSFVGPRPESLRFADLYQGDWVRLLDFQPGLFGPCQIAYRNESALYPEDEDPETFYRRELFPQKARIDIDYFSTSTCLMDMVWIGRGLWVTIAGAADWRAVVREYGKTVALDTAIVLLSWVAATVLRFSGIPRGIDHAVFLSGLFVLPPVILAGLVMGGVYKTYGEGYFSFVDAVSLASSATLSCGAAFLLIIIFESRNVSFYLLPMYWLVLLWGLAMPRIWHRLKREKALASQQEANPVFIYGADPSAIALANWLTYGQRKKVLAYFDEAMKITGKQIMGIPILTRSGDILTLKAGTGACEMWSARPLNEDQGGRLAQFCALHGLKLVMLPEGGTLSEFKQAV